MRKTLCLRTPSGCRLVDLGSIPCKEKSCFCLPPPPNSGAYVPFSLIGTGVKRPQSEDNHKLRLVLRLRMRRACSLILHMSSQRHFTFVCSFTRCKEVEEENFTFSSLQCECNVTGKLQVRPFHRLPILFTRHNLDQRQSYSG